MAAEAMKAGPGDACLELEVIAAYLDHRVTERERKEITSHLASCESCYFVFTEAAQMRAAEGSAHVTDLNAARQPPQLAWWKRPRLIGPVAAGLAAAAIVVIAVGIGIRTWRTNDLPELTALVAAVGADRTIEPRLTGGFAYGPLRGAVRAGEPTSETISPDIRIAAAAIEKRTGKVRTDETLHALGL